MPGIHDVIVIGAGHAGCEAAHIAALMGARTMLLTIQPDAIGRMSCNPAIGGMAKGHLVREIDALGGIMARAIDATGIQFRMLNTRKGPAVRGLRAQADRHHYSAWMRYALENIPNLEIRQGMAIDLMHDDNGVCGVILECGSRIPSRTVIITAGTFLDGQVHIGMHHYAAGRCGEPPSDKLPRTLEAFGLKLGRFMTDTVPRLDKRTIDFSGLEAQYGDDPPVPFSFSTPSIDREQLPCYITYTNPETHKIILDNVDKSPVLAGAIHAVPPRYCPDIETKILRYPDRDRHQIFLEPEGLNTNEIYPNGIFTTMPEEVQIPLIHSIKGLENARIIRLAYGIEYTYSIPTQLNLTEEIRSVPNLFSAGQVNGTSGYEEAAAQGIIAGINAALKIKGKEPFILRRDEAYMGVLIDDLVNKGTNEPYRMFTSRAEYRLLLRHDNADLRLAEHSRRLGLMNDEKWDAFNRYRDSIEKEKTRLKKTWLKTSELDKNYLKKHELGDISKNLSLFQFLQRPELNYKHLDALGLGGGLEDPRAVEQIDISVKYAGYIEKQKREIARLKKMEEYLLPGDMDYKNIKGITAEAAEKLDEHRPGTLGQATRISGVSSGDITVLLIHLKSRKRRKFT
jgi:tRNA uridine 5-carboxymethylaminomethyl modification enzyme